MFAQLCTKLITFEFPRTISRSVGEGGGKMLPIVFPLVDTLIQWNCTITTTTAAAIKPGIYPLFHHHITSTVGWRHHNNNRHQHHRHYPELPWSIIIKLINSFVGKCALFYYRNIDVLFINMPPPWPTEIHNTPLSPTLPCSPCLCVCVCLRNAHTEHSITRALMTALCEMVTVFNVII